LPISQAAADQALTHYEAAARFAPFDSHVRSERDLALLARQILARPTPGPVDPALGNDLPMTAEFASLVCAGWSDYATVRNAPRFNSQQLEAATAEDLRAVGYLALLCGEPAITMDAWETLDLKGNSDPLVDATFRFVYLINTQFGRAYPRLRNAVQAFQNGGFLNVFLAEAAIECGDYDKAQYWLDQARSLPRLDRFRGLARVQAGLFGATGNDFEARLLYEQLLNEDKNIVAFDQY